MTTIQATASRSTTLTSSSVAHPQLKQGAKGPAVKLMQKLLEAKGYELGAQDGVFGPKTASALERFQSQHGLVADGICGPKTWAKLLSNNTSTPVTPTQPVDGFDGAKTQGDKIAEAAAKLASQRYHYVWGGGHRASPGASTGSPNSNTVVDDVHTKGYDCSGFARQAVFLATGKDLMAGTAATQFTKCKPISKADLKPGDLLFFGSPIHHVAVYAGKKNGVPMMYESAPSYERNGSSYGTHYTPVSYQGTPSHYGRVK